MRGLCVRGDGRDGRSGTFSEKANVGQRTHGPHHRPLGKLTGRGGRSSKRRVFWFFNLGGQVDGGNGKEG